MVLSGEDCGLIYDILYAKESEIVEMLPSIEAKKGTKEDIVSDFQDAMSSLRAIKRTKSHSTGELDGEVGKWTRPMLSPELAAALLRTSSQETSDDDVERGTLIDLGAESDEDSFLEQPENLINRSRSAPPRKMFSLKKALGMAKRY